MHTTAQGIMHGMNRYKEITIGPYPEHRPENFLIFRQLAKVMLVEIQYINMNCVAIMSSPVLVGYYSNLQR